VHPIMCSPWVINRDNSADSRYMDQVGFVPVENLVGRAEILFSRSMPNIPGGNSGNGRSKSAGPGC